MRPETVAKIEALRKRLIATQSKDIEALYTAFDRAASISKKVEGIEDAPTFQAWIVATEDLIDTLEALKVLRLQKQAALSMEKTI